MMQTVTKKQDADFYINLLRQLPGLILVMDKNSKFLYSNKYTAEMFGYLNEEEMIGIDAYGMKCPAVESASDFIKQDKMVMATAKELTVLDIHQYANGDNKILITKKLPYIAEGNIAGSICHCTDIHSATFSKIVAALIQSDQKYYSANHINNRSYMIGRSANDVLTEREMDCVFYLMRGNTMKRIAKYMNISPRTVETHLENIKTKLNCNDKADIVEYCLAEGLLNYIPNIALARDLSKILYTTNNEVL